MPMNMQTVKQYLNELRNTGGLHKDQAEKFVFHVLECRLK